MLQNLRSVQKKHGILPSRQLETMTSKVDWGDGRKATVTRPVFTIEMETGTGKTYTYIKSMYELNARYGWSKFIIVVPNVAIREGVAKSFQITADHFREDYGKACRFFIYSSSRLTDLEHFADDPGINVMIINTQAFNASGKDARRIYMKLDSFRSRRPIDVIAAVNPIVIIDEPQSVIGAAGSKNVTRDALGKFNPLFYVNYSATHRENFNMVYRLDAVDAYQQQLALSNNPHQQVTLSKWPFRRLPRHRHTPRHSLQCHQIECLNPQLTLRPLRRKGSSAQACTKDRLQSKHGCFT